MGGKTYLILNLNCVDLEYLDVKMKKITLKSKIKNEIITWPEIWFWKIVLTVLLSKKVNERLNLYSGTYF